MELERLREKAAAVNRRREAEGSVVATKKRTSRFTRRRLIIWLLEFFVLVFVFEQFVWRPWRLRREATRIVVRRTYPLGDSVPVLGDQAMPLRGLREIVDTHLAATEGLAAGATTAQAAQVQVGRELGLPIEVENSLGLRLRLIPNGSFVMGSPPSEPGRGLGELQHVREIPSPFYLGKWEVTQAEWKAVMGVDDTPSGFIGDRRPVEEIQWYDAQRFLIALSEREGVPRWTYRLPSEAEWEYAGRAGSTTAYHFGDNPARLPEFDFFRDNSHGRSQPCGLKRPNAYGLHDMHGNVWEWCRDAYANYPGSDAPDDTRGLWRTIRGGNFHVYAPDCRSAERARLPPRSHGNLLGFRVMRVIPELFDVLDASEPVELPPEETLVEPPPEEDVLPEAIP